MVNIPETILIPQKSFRLYFRELHGILQWIKLPNGDIICERSLVFGFLQHAIDQSLIWTMERFHIFYLDDPDCPMVNEDDETMIEQSLKKIDQSLIQALPTSRRAFKIFFRPIGDIKWLLISNGDLICDLRHIEELTIQCLKSGVLNDNIERFDVYYHDGGDVPPKIDINFIVAEIIKKAGDDR